MASRSLRFGFRTPAEALQFAVDFVETEIADDVDPQVLGNRVDHFLSDVGSEVVYVTPRLELDEWREVRRHARGVLLTLVKSRSVLVRLNLDYVFGQEVSIVPGETWPPDVEMGRYRLHATGSRGSMRDRFTFRMLQLVEDLQAVEKLLPCPAPKCGRLFLKVTNKEHCSTRCQSRVYMREWRKKNSTTKGSRHAKKTRPR